MDGYFLRHEPTDRDTLPSRIASARAELDEASRREDSKSIIDACGNLVALLTAARRESEALPIGLSYLSLARSNSTLEESAWLLHQVATAAQYHGLRAQANNLFGEALQSCRQHGWRKLEHFVLHHWGRSQVEEGNLQGAERCFRESRAIRVELCEPLVSSDRAISELAKLQRASGQGKTSHG